MRTRFEKHLVGDIFRFYLDINAETFSPKLTISGITENIPVKFTEDCKTIILQSPINLPIYSNDYINSGDTKSYTNFKIPKTIAAKILRWKQILDIK